MTEKELERLVILIINQQMMDDRNLGHVEYDFSQGGSIQEFVPPLPLLDEDRRFTRKTWLMKIASAETSMAENLIAASMRAGSNLRVAGILSLRN